LTNRLRGGKRKSNGAAGKKRRFVGKKKKWQAGKATRVGWGRVRPGNQKANRKRKAIEGIECKVTGKRGEKTVVVFIAKHGKPQRPKIPNKREQLNENRPRERPVLPCRKNRKKNKKEFKKKTR